MDALFNAVTGHTHNGSHQGAPVPASTIANGSITNAQLGPDVARASLLTNGGFEVWQRGAGGVPCGGFCADGWIVANSAPATISVSQDAANVDSIGNSKYAAACVVTLSRGAANLSAEGRRLYATAGQDHNGLVPRANDECWWAELPGRHHAEHLKQHAGDVSHRGWNVAYVDRYNHSTNQHYHPDRRHHFLGQRHVLRRQRHAGGWLPASGLRPAPPSGRVTALPALLRAARQGNAGQGLVQAFAYGATTAVFLFHYKVPKAIVPTVTFQAALTNYTLANAAAATLAFVPRSRIAGLTKRLFKEERSAPVAWLRAMPRSYRRLAVAEIS